MSKIITWNVNGYRAIIKKGFLAWLQQSQPDILALQETKAHPDQLSSIEKSPLGYQTYWSSAEKAGYSGTALFCKRPPLNVLYGIGDPSFDQEGRTVTVEMENYYVLSCYFPNSQPERKRLSYKLEYCAAMQQFLTHLRSTGKGVILCGDLNIAHCPIDLARPKDNENSPGYYQEERDWLSSFFSTGYIDCFRHLYPDEVCYTWWSYRSQARARNVGWRIDYQIIDPSLLKKLANAEILTNVVGSDHCPCELTIKE